MAQAADRADKLQHLLDDPSFQILVREFRERREKWFEGFAKGLMGGIEVDQRKLDYYRGYWAGAGAVLANPDRAVRHFERLMESEQETKG